MSPSRSETRPSATRRAPLAGRTGIAALALALAAACGGDGDGDDGAAGADGGPTPDGAPSADGGPGACDRSGLVPATQQAERSDEDGIVFFTAVTADPPADVLTIDLYFALGATDGPATTAFDGENFATCGTCVLARTSCEDGICDRLFLAESGTLAITALGGDGDPFAATLTDVRLTEVTVDTNSLESTPVAGGETWCIDDQAVGATVEGV